MWCNILYLVFMEYTYLHNNIYVDIRGKYIDFRIFHTAPIALVPYIYIYEVIRIKFYMHVGFDFSIFAYTSA